MSRATKVIMKDDPLITMPSLIEIHCMQDRCVAWKSEQRNKMVNGQMFPVYYGYCRLMK